MKVLTFKSEKDENENVTSGVGFGIFRKHRLCTKQQNNEKLQERVQKGMRTKERVQQAGMQMPG
ncbi:MAG: hypothetical protein K2P54_09620 [Odoribacter sp.]|nr:hypothetical protein [Odoribacter sp.]